MGLWGVSDKILNCSPPFCPKIWYFRLTKGEHILIGVSTPKKTKQNEKVYVSTKVYVSKETLYSKHQSFYLPKGSPIKVGHSPFFHTPWCNYAVIFRMTLTWQWGGGWTLESTSKWRQTLRQCLARKGMPGPGQAQASARTSPSASLMYCHQW